MRIGKAIALPLIAFAISTVAMAQDTSGQIDAHIANAKKAAGLDFRGTFIALCLPGAPPAAGAGSPLGQGAVSLLTPRPAPDRATWYASPYKVFDNLYWLGTRTFLLGAQDQRGIIIIDTNFDYAIEPEIVEGLTKLGLNPATSNMSSSAMPMATMTRAWRCCRAAMAPMW